MNEPNTLLVVDDTAVNLHLLTRILAPKGYQVQTALSGPLALTAVSTDPPDLILLDICMPGMDGYEVCKTLKANPQTCDIPIIFLSAANELVDKNKALELGGIDYITKPFQTAEVLARVDVHLQLIRLQRQLHTQDLQMQQEVAAREQLEQKYRSIFENCMEGIFQASTDGCYLSANPSLARIYGYDTPQEMLSQKDWGRKQYVRPGRLEELHAYLQRFGHVSDFESQVYRQDGSTLWISETVREIRDATGRLLHYEGTVQDISERRHTEAELRRQRQQAEQLLLSILPQPIAERLKRKPDVIADSFENVTVVFADVVNFTSLSARVSPHELVSLLNQIFSAFDQLAEKFGLEKIKTIGDAYLVVAGIPVPNRNHVVAAADMALAMQEVIRQFQSDLGEPFQLRIGINTGPVVAGVIGKKKFIYDLWGNAVNLASRMQSLAEPGTIQVTDSTYHRLKAQYYLEERGNIEVKGFGFMTTYWLKGKQQDAIALPAAAES